MGFPFVFGIAFSRIWGEMDVMSGYLIPGFSHLSFKEWFVIKYLE